MLFPSWRRVYLTELSWWNLYEATQGSKFPLFILIQRLWKNSDLWWVNRAWETLRIRSYPVYGPSVMQIYYLEERHSVAPGQLSICEAWVSKPLLWLTPLIEVDTGISGIACLNELRALGRKRKTSEVGLELGNSYLKLDGENQLLAEEGSVSRIRALWKTERK